MPREAHALAYLEAVIRYVTAAGANINAENVRSAIEQGASDGEELTGASTCSTREGAAHIASSRLLISIMRMGKRHEEKNLVLPAIER
jgi:hypothetical protein